MYKQSNMVLELVIKGEFPSFNGMIDKTKIHWGAYSSSKKKLTTRVAKAAKKYLQELYEKDGTITYECGFVFNWYVKTKRKDQDNICFAKKYILDGLQEADIIATDGWKVVSAGFHERFYIDKENPRVEVSILTKDQFLERFKKHEPQKQVYSFVYSSNTWESAYRTMSIHRTKAGAYKAMRLFLLRENYKFNNMRRLRGKKGVLGELYDKWGVGVGWGINTVDLID